MSNAGPLRLANMLNVTVAKSMCVRAQHVSKRKVEVENVGSKQPIAKTTCGTQYFAFRFSERYVFTFLKCILTFSHPLDLASLEALIEVQSSEE